MNKTFRLLVQTRLLMSFAVQIQALVMGWQMYELTHDPLPLGLIGLTEALPALSLAPFAGHLVDRSNPLRIFRLLVLFSTLSAAILLGVSWGDAPWAGLLTQDLKVRSIYAAAFITGTSRAFAGPSLYALVPQIIPRNEIRKAAPWLSGSVQLASVAGPALGGLLYAWKGAILPYLADACLLIAAIGSLFLVRFQPKAPEIRHHESFVESVTSGAKYVFSNQLLLSAMSLDMFAVLFGGVTAILPVFAADILTIGPTGLGVLRAAPAVGAIAMTLILLRIPVGRHAGRILLSVVTGFGFCILGFALSRELWLSVILLGLSGALDSVSMVIRTSIVQLNSPEHLRGRIAAVNSIFIGSSNEIGAFESGVAARLLGTVPSVIFGGTMTLLTVLGTGWLAPKLRSFHLGAESESSS